MLSLDVMVDTAAGELVSSVKSIFLSTNEIYVEISVVILNVRKALFKESFYLRSC